MESLSEDSSVAPDLYFLIAKFLAAGPLKDTTKVLVKELENLKVLPKRLDWLGNFHDQSYDELCERYGDLPARHLLDLCKALLGTCQPKRSLLSRRLVEQGERQKLHSLVSKLYLREVGFGPISPRTPSALLSHRLYKELRVQRRTLGHLSAVYCVLYDRTGDFIITGADDLLVKIWSCRDGRLMSTLRGASSEITDLAVSPDNRLLAAGSLDKLLRVWDLTNAAPIAVLQGHGGMITSVNFCPAKAGDLRCLASTSTDGSVAFWTYQQTGPNATPIFCPDPNQFMERMRPGVCHMICCSWSSGGTFLASGSADCHVRLYMMAEGGPRRVLEVAAHSEAVDSLAWAHRGLKLVSGSKDGVAILWTLHATQWKRTNLDINNDATVSDESKKAKVTMVSWDCDDAYIMTAASDHTIRVWCARTYKQIRILSGHSGEAYVLESHPFISRVALSAGHDGMIFIWDIEMGGALKQFENEIQGQEPGAVYDAKWSPNGVNAVATDSHGHLLMLGFGEGDPLLKKLPVELFFHTDYRSLIRDASGFVLDEQTGVPPHEMPPAFLVDVEGAPHPPALQKLVPGRERADVSQLVPYTEHDTNERSLLDMMIDRLASHLEMHYHGGDDNSEDATNNESNQNEERARRLEGVRNTAAGLWNRGELIRNNHMLTEPVDHKHTDELLELEMSWYAREMRRRPLMISTANNSSASAAAGGGQQKSKRSRKPPRRTVPQVHFEEDEMEDEDDEADDSEANSNSSSTSDVSLRLSELSSDDSQRKKTKRHKERKRNSSSSSAYSDWVGDKRTVSLQPPARSRRRRVPRRVYTPEVEEEVEVEVSEDVNRTEERPAAEKKTVKVVRKKKVPPVELLEIYRPSEWLCAYVPRKAPYHPQMGDECLYFRLGHERYFDAVTDKEVYTVSLRDKPWERTRIDNIEHVKVVGIKYIIKPPRLVCLRLSVLPACTRSFTVKYHDMADVIDFLVLKQHYDAALNRGWKPNDRFRCMIDDNWWTGTVISNDTESTSVPEPGPSSSTSEQNGFIELDARHFLGLVVRWDNGEQERMSPWDLEPINEARLPPELTGCVPVLAEEVKAVLYRPQPGEWPHDSRERATAHILTALEQVMSLAIAEPFIAPVDLNSYPSYAYVVEYPIDLSTIKARFENYFYRRAAAAQFDVRYLATNAEKFNQAHSTIVRQARIVTDILLHIISNWWEVDVNAVYRQLSENYKTSESEEVIKPSGEIHENWLEKCKNIMKELRESDDIFAFLNPVSLEQAPDYLSIVTNPMDFGTISKRLDSDYYTSSSQFQHDARLVFSNSLLYNTNKRSKIYSMTIRLRNLFEDLWENAQDGGGWKTRRRKKKRDKSYPEYTSSDDEPLADTSRKEATSRKGKGRGKRSHKSPSDEPEMIAPEIQPPLAACIPTTSQTISPRTTLPDASTTSESEEETRMQNLEVLEEEFVEEDVEVTYASSSDGTGKVRAKHKTGAPSIRRKRVIGAILDSADDSDYVVADTKRRKSKKPYKRRESVLKASPDDVHTTSDEEWYSGDSELSRQRYESDHSYRPRVDSEDDVPLNALRQNGRSNVENESGAGPSRVKSKSRKKKRRRANECVKYNEDSEEDSIAAISKRIHSHKPVRRAPFRDTIGTYVNGHQQRNGGSSSMTLDEAAITSVSSRGRVRKPTAKVRGLD